MRLNFIVFCVLIAVAISVDFATPIYHFHSHSGWINDPNGPIFHGGTHHLFYQWNPNDVVWGNIHWGHATSSDLINWTIKAPALSPMESYETKGCWSGGAMASPNGKTVTLMYTCVGDDMVQRQCVATTNDMVKFTKAHNNPIVRKAPAPLLPDQFRDPQPVVCPTAPSLPTGIILGGGDGKHGYVELYEAADPTERWTHVATIAEGHSARDWECPDLFGWDTGRTPSGDPLHVLTVSLDKRYETRYYTGVWSPEKRRLVDPVRRVLDHGTMYAPRSYSVDDRRVMWGWMNETVDAVEAGCRELGWAGVLTVPREVFPQMSGRVGWRPVKELAQLMGQPVRFDNVVKGAANLPGAGLHTHLSMTVSTAHTPDDAIIDFAFDPTLGERTTMTLSWSRQTVTIDRSFSTSLTLPGIVNRPIVVAHRDMKRQVSLVVLTDGNVMEVFIDEIEVASYRIYPSRANRGLVRVRGRDVRVAGVVREMHAMTIDVNR